MMDIYFNEQVYKNNLLLDESNIWDVCCIEMFKDDVVFDTMHTLKYGYISIIVKGINKSIVVSYDNVILRKISVDGECLIPINFVKGNQLKVSGECLSIVIRVYGAKLINKPYLHLMPLNKLIQVGVGNKIVNSYNSCDDIESGTYIQLTTLNTNTYMQTYIKDNVVGLGLLDYNNGLVFSSSFDDYSNKLKICTEQVDDAIFINNHSTNTIVFVYIKSGKVFYKVYDGQVDKLGEESVISIGGNVVGLLSSIVNTFDSKFFGVKSSVGVVVYIIKADLQVEKVYESKINYLRIFENQNNIMFSIFDNYAIRLVEFNCDEGKSGSGVLQYKNSTNYTNLHDVLICNNVNIYTNLCGDKFIIQT